MIVLIMMTVTAEIMFNTNIMLIMMIMIMAMIGGGWLPLEDSFSPPQPPANWTRWTFFQKVMFSAELRKLCSAAKVRLSILSCVRSFELCELG